MLAMIAVVAVRLNLTPAMSCAGTESLLIGQIHRIVMMEISTLVMDVVKLAVLKLGLGVMEVIQLNQILAKKCAETVLE
jgi:hypothetical protein